jgi:hypothetical protein
LPLACSNMTILSLKTSPNWRPEKNLNLRSCADHIYRYVSATRFKSAESVKKVSVVLYGW